jgi:hypothetical protein
LKSGKDIHGAPQMKFANALKLSLKIFVAIGILAAAFQAYLYYRTEPVGWEFIQQTGGCSVSDVKKQGGDWVVQINYDISGLTVVTRRPLFPNSMLSVHNIISRVKADAKEVEITFTRGQITRSYPQGFPLYLKLPGNLQGVFKVVYRNNDKQSFEIGHIEFK